MPFAQDLNQQITALEAQFHTALQDGFDLSEIIGLLMQGIMAFVQISKQYQDIPENRKQRVIVQSLKRVYMSRHVDLPWIPEPFESMLEGLLFDTLLPELYKALVKQPEVPQVAASAQSVPKAML